MASQDPNPQGGSITDMAVDGTKVPDDAGAQYTIPSVPRPDQITDPSDDPSNLGATDLAGAADNAQDVSRTTRDTAPNPETITGTGDALPPEIGSKRLHNDVNQDLSKGHQRYDKHVKQKGSDQEKGASEGATEDEVVDGVIGGR
ncbi:hypothetical protein HO133_006613 [Letharia lupina]|uniref:Uncharacterized protein n=1 Tax=Letharia lupina TaxID=560253 RepID=A0A8H6C6W9_9LECA|nr:uncharacterized protein HO133_006613 [Letharia lupina]KAF6217786.1 hypothetical protein HO133_006613 [Letharia lupina]